MIPKPDTCKGCPWYGDGQGFVPDELPAGCEVVFIAQNPGETEEAQGRPLIGQTGQILRQQFVARHLAGRRVGYANVVKCRRQSETGVRSNAMPPLRSNVWTEIKTHCRQYLEATLAQAPEALRVAMGEYSIAALAPELMVPGRKKAKVLHVRGTVL